MSVEVDCFWKTDAQKIDWGPGKKYLDIAIQGNERTSRVFLCTLRPGECGREGRESGTRASGNGYILDE
jgi:hypothetical protein